MIGQIGVSFPSTYGYARRYISKNYPYLLEDGPDATPIDLDDLKEYLRVDPADTVEDAYLESLIRAATIWGEKYCRRDFITKTYTTYRDDFSGSCFQLQKSPFIELNSFEYLKDGVLTPVNPATYYMKITNDFSSIYRKINTNWPLDADIQLQTIKISFDAGYGDAAEDVPDDLRMALMQHCAALYENRGDCDSGDCGKGLPAGAKIIYDQYRILSITTEPY